MNVTYKNVSIYVDEKENLIALPYGESKKYGMKELDVVFEIKSPYNDESLAAFLVGAMDKCYSKIANDTEERSSLEKFLNIKGFSKAVKNRRLVGFSWFKDSGYVIIPTEKKPRQGFVHMEEKTINLGKEVKIGELTKAFREAMQLSKT